MAAQITTFVGQLTTDNYSGTAVFVGTATPTQPPGVGGKPPGIWGGPIDPYPGHPLPEPPPGGGGDGKPPGIWGGPIDPYPGHPLPPVEPPSPQPPGQTWQWGWNARLGWHPVYVPGPTDPSPHGG